MPKQTFLNLNESKRRNITDAFLREFATNSYDDASLSAVVKQLGIAKGSVYQYFNNKYDLFMFLLQDSGAVKGKYVGSIARENYPDFWAYFKELYERGYLFDKENPLQSHFLHRLTQNLNSPSIKPLHTQLMQQTVVAFEAMVAHEVRLGMFRDDIPVITLGFALYKMGVAIMEQLEFTGVIDPQKSIEQHIPVYQNKRHILMKTVDEYICMLKPAFDKG